MKYIKKIFIVFIFFICIFTLKVYAKDITIVIDPGHGGIDAGSVNKKAGIIEKDVNLKIARYLKQYLEEYANIKVIITHNGFSSKKMELIDRALVARKNNADLLISIHCNATDTSRTLNGAEAYVTANKSLPKYNQECTILANKILDNISKLGIRRIGVKTRLSTQSDEVYSDGTRGDYYGIIRYAMKGIVEGPGANIQNGEGISAVLVEHCYIQNGDENYINNENGIKNLARADCNAIAEYYHLRLKSKVVSGIALDTVNLTVAKGDTLSLNATISPSTAEDKKIIWSSSNEKIAVVNNGKVTGISEGEAVITAKTNDGGYTASCKVLVKNIDIDIDIGNDKIYLLKNDEKQIFYEVIPYLPDGYMVKFKSENTEISDSNSKYIISAKEKGETYLNVKLYNNKNEIVSEKNIPIKVSELEENEYINIEKYMLERSIITKIKAGTQKDELLKNIKISENLEVVIENSDSTIKTGTKVIIKRKSEENNIIKIDTCMVLGDINCDGQITPADYVKIKNHIMNVSKLNNLQYIAADIDKNNSITPADYVKVKNHIMKVKEIEV